jgi:hypothetical protein
MILFSIPLFLSVICIKAQTINATGSWSVSVPSNTISEPGNDYDMSLTSMANQTMLDITMATTISWRVDVHKQDSFWNAFLTLWIHKTGDGMGTSESSILPIGLTPYLQVSNLGQLFFAGTSNHANIPIQYEIRGLSVLIPASTYETVIIYTITEY